MIDFKQISENILNTLKKYENLFIYIKGSPDPDVIASSYALKLFCDTLINKNISIISLMPVSLPQNRMMITNLAIPISFLSETPDFSDYDGYIVLDHQTAYVEQIKDSIPCILHIDHHEETKDLIKPELQILLEEVGSISTIFALFFKELKPGIEKNLMSKIATALTYGIQTDTDDLKLAKEYDTKAIHYLKPLVNKSILKSITNIPFSEETVTILSKAMINQINYKGWILSGVGFISESYRDSIAIIADYLLKNEDATTIIIFAIIKKDDGSIHLDTSLRTKNKNFDLNHFIKKITPNGGARQFKGAYQLDLNYFSHCTDKNMLWKVIQDSTIEKIKYERDNIRVIGEENIFFKVKRSIKSFFKKKYSKNGAQN